MQWLIVSPSPIELSLLSASGIAPRLIAHVNCVLTQRVPYARYTGLRPCYAGAEAWHACGVAKALMHEVALSDCPMLLLDFFQHQFVCMNDFFLRCTHAAQKTLLPAGQNAPLHLTNRKSLPLVRVCLLKSSLRQSHWVLCA